MVIRGAFTEREDELLASLHEQLRRVTNDDEVVRPARQPIAGFGHRVIKRREIDVRPQRTGTR